MTTQRINGISFDVKTESFALHIQKMSLDITDNSAVAKRNGRPDGFLAGDVEASGTLTIDSDALSTLTNEAKRAGCWQAIPPFDIQTYAKVGDKEVKVRAYGCLINLSKLLDIDKSSTDETVFEVPFKVTSPDFVEINDVPYLKKLND